MELGKSEMQESLRGACGGRGAPLEKSAIMTFVEDFWIHFLQNGKKVDGIRMPLDFYYECLYAKSTLLFSLVSSNMPILFPLCVLWATNDVYKVA